jgi:chloramphenicol-sensitive protein RarD
MVDRRGILYAVLAYGGWGLLPVYWKQFEAMSPYELLAWRVIWSALFVWLLVLWVRRAQSTIQVMRSSRRALWMAVAAVLITGNWLTYIVAVNTGHIVESSLGYYINPLVNVLLGQLFLRERLSGMQWVAMALAAAGVAVMIGAYGHVPWLALLLAGTFGFYGLVKKKVSVDAMASLTWETTLVFPFAALYVGGLHAIHADTVGALTPVYQVALSLSGVVTAVPLLWFGLAAKRLDLATLGMVQYLAPTMQLLLGVFVYREPFTVVDLVAFGFIWSALVLYTFTMVRTQRVPRRLQAGKSQGAPAGGSRP